jgi:IMP dehydrogenase
MSKFESTVTFEDVLLRPQYSDIVSRKEIDTSSKISEHLAFHMPIISSPMDTVTEAPMASKMADLGGLGIIHRYCSIEQQGSMVEQASSDRKIIGAAIGITGDYFERAKYLVDHSGAKVLCIDVAHGHHSMMKTALETLRTEFNDYVCIIAGNVATLQGFNDLSDWGADSIRVGIGGGSICSTRIQTGHGMPTLQSVLECSQSDRSASLIADGGIKTSGDIVKCLAAGADFVLLGSLLAGTSETPGEAFYSKGVQYKPYRGMASVEAQINWRGHTSSVEGVSHVVPYKGPVERTISELCRGIRSGLSYSGCRSITEFQSRARFVRQTAAGQFESSTHIKSRF